MRPAHLEEQDLSALARAVVVPEGVRHTYIRLPSVTLRRATPAKAERRAPVRKLTLKQKRAAK